MPKNTSASRNLKTRVPRSDSSFTRSLRKKESERILIVCEGEKTEVNYFKGLCQLLRLPTVEVAHDNSAPISVVDGAIKRKQYAKKNGDDFNEVWCVFDRDHHPTFFEAIDKAKAHDLKLAISVPSFEYWYLLYFESAEAGFENCDAVIAYLKNKGYFPNYEKKDDIITELKSKSKFRHVEVADLAENLYKRRLKELGFKDSEIAAIAALSSSDEEPPNPSTTVYKLIRRLYRMAPHDLASQI
jgi:hypothetical protein